MSSPSIEGDGGSDSSSQIVEYVYRFRKCGRSETCSDESVSTTELLSFDPKQVAKKLNHDGSSKVFMPQSSVCYITNNKPIIRKIKKSDKQTSSASKKTRHRSVSRCTCSRTPAQVPRPNNNRYYNSFDSTDVMTARTYDVALATGSGQPHIGISKSRTSRRHRKQSHNGSYLRNDMPPMCESRSLRPAKSQAPLRLDVGSCTERKSRYNNIQMPSRSRWQSANEMSPRYNFQQCERAWLEAIRNAPVAGFENALCQPEVINLPDIYLDDRNTHKFQPQFPFNFSMPKSHHQQAHPPLPQQQSPPQQQQQQQQQPPMCRFCNYPKRFQTGAHVRLNADTSYRR